jgi:predicted transcriptional regulator
MRPRSLVRPKDSPEFAASFKWRQTFHLTATDIANVMKLSLWGIECGT